MPSSTATAAIEADVAIVGAGPAGLMLAIELGCRGVRCVVLEEDDDVPVPPKANATSARTMEHYRRRGFAHEVRSAGLTPDHPQDVVFCTRLGGEELVRFAIPSRNDAVAQATLGDLSEAGWPTPELPHRGNQRYIEPILRRQARRWPSVSLSFGHRATEVTQSADGISVHCATAQGSRLVTASYVVGCEGPRSVVREAIGGRYLGLSGEQRDFFGGQMLSLHFRSPDLARALGRRAWTRWLFNRDQRGVLVALDGIEEFIFGIQLPPGLDAVDVDPEAVFAAASRVPFQRQLIGRAPWTAGHMLVCDRFRSGRLFIAGDAAHLFTPTGGMGYNTSVDDAVNLGWKLAAAVQGWAGDGLLDSYESERRPIAVRNTAFARRMAESIGRLTVPEGLEQDSEHGRALRAELAQRLRAHAASEYDVPGIQLGLRYESAIVSRDPDPPPADSDTAYVPGGYPGARAPHVALKDGTSNLDRYGDGFTLLGFETVDVGAWMDCAWRLRVPLQVLYWPEAASTGRARALHGAELVLIRPDHHIAWRGVSTADPAEVLSRAVGHRTQRPMS